MNRITKQLLLVVAVAALPAPAPPLAGSTSWNFNPLWQYRANFPQGWSQQSSKVVFDGSYFYTTTNPSSGAGLVVRMKNGDPYQTCDSTGTIDASYQAASLVSDYAGNLVVVAAQAFAAPIIKMTTQPPRLSDNFSDVRWMNLPTLQTRAAYVSLAAYHRGPDTNYLIMVYWNPVDENTHIARLDLNDLPSGWVTNLLNVSTNTEKWLYYSIHIRNLNNINLGISSAPTDGLSHYTKALYVKSDWAGNIGTKEYIVSSGAFNAFITDMVQGFSGKLHFALRYERRNGEPYRLFAVTRDRANRYVWTRLAKSPYAVDLTHTIFYSRPNDARLYAVTSHERTLRLYLSRDNGKTFSLLSKRSGPNSMGYISGVKQSSGGVYPDAPMFTMTSDVSGGVKGRYRQWLLTVDWPWIDY